MYIKQSNTQDIGTASFIVDDYDANGVFIGQHNEDRQTTGNTVVVNTDGFIGDLTTHPSVVEHPESYTIVDDVLPEKYSIINYQSTSNAPLVGQTVLIGGVQYTLGV